MTARPVPNLQIAYNASPTPEIVVDATRGALTVQDNATPTGEPLFEVLENDGTPLIRAGVDFDEGITFGKMRDTLGSPVVRIYQSPDAFQSFNIWPDSMTFNQAFGSGINFGSHVETYTAAVNGAFWSGINQRGKYVNEGSTQGTGYATVMNQSATFINEATTFQTRGSIVTALQSCTNTADTIAVTCTGVGGVDVSPSCGNANGGAMTVNEIWGARLAGGVHLFDTTLLRAGVIYANPTLGFGTLNNSVGLDVRALTYGTYRAAVRSLVNTGGFGIDCQGSAPSQFAGEVRMLGDNVASVYGAGQDADIYYDATDLIIDPDVAGSGRVLIGATGDDDLTAAQIVNTAGRIKNTTRVTTTYTILVTDSVVFGNTDGGAFTATLPVGAQGQDLRVINSGSSGNDLTLDPDGSEDLIGANSSFTLRDGEALAITYDSTDGWY